MQVELDPRRNHTRRRAALAAMLLLTGGLVGYLIGLPDQEAPSPPRPPVLGGAVPPLLPGPRQVAGELPLLEIAISPEDWRRIAPSPAGAPPEPGAKAKAPVTVRSADETATGILRVKRNGNGHAATGPGALRFELDAPVRGMRRFVVRPADQPGIVTEWIALRTAHRLGLLAPRAEFIQLAIGDREPAIHYLEEWPAKELLERQGRRDGAILKFDDRAFEAARHQLDLLTTGAVPADFERMFELFDTQALVMDEKRLARTGALEQRVHRALQQARELQSALTAELYEGELVRARLELRRLQGRTVDDLFFADRFGKLLALYTFFQGFHGLRWDQVRLYHDPVTDRLEPIANDSGADLRNRPGELALHAAEARWLRCSPRVIVAAYEQLGQLTAPGYLEAVLAELRPELERVTAALAAAGTELPDFHTLDSLDALLRQQVERLRALVHPPVTASFDARVIGVRTKKNGDRRAVEVDVRATTGVPTRLSGFRFGNGRTVLAGIALVGVVGTPDSEDLVTRLPGDGVLLPGDGRALRFRFPVDYRLLALDEIRAIKKAIRQNLVGPRSGQLELSALARPVSEEEDRDQPLVLRRDSHPETNLEGRPKPPTVAEALRRHPFLAHDIERGELFVGAGRHVVEGDLILPEHRALHLRAGAELRFAPEKVMVIGALRVTGTPSRPVRILAMDRTPGFGGVLVLGTAGASHCSGLVVENASSIARGGWQTTGGVTFLHAPVELQGCTFLGARGEDALNLVRLRFRAQACEFTDCRADQFDGDSVDGSIVDCTFVGAGRDAIDLSGSSVTVLGCTFERVDDEAFSLGEGTRLTTRDCRVVDASIAVTCRDGSRAVVERLTVDAARRFVLACYRRKPEFGPAELRATELIWTGSGTPAHLVQTGCTLTIDGEPVPGQDLDVDRLYRDGVLGR